MVKTCIWSIFFALLRDLKAFDPEYLQGLHASDRIGDREASRAHHAAFVCMQVAAKPELKVVGWSGVAAKVLIFWGSNGGRDRD